MPFFWMLFFFFKCTYYPIKKRYRPDSPSPAPLDVLPKLQPVTAPGSIFTNIPAPNKTYVWNGEKSIFQKDRRNCCPYRMGGGPRSQQSMKVHLEGKADRERGTDTLLLWQS